MNQHNIIIKGRCLSGIDGALRISPFSKLDLYLYEDSKKPVKIPVDIAEIMVKNHFVSIGRIKTISVVEHLFSALYGLALFNIRIDFLGNEIPFFDGSSYAFVKKLKKIPHSFPIIVNPKKKIVIKEENSFIIYEPSAHKRLIIEMELKHPYIKSQSISFNLSRENYITEIAPARTFIFTEDSDPRLKNLPAYGFAITRSNVYSKEVLRFADEAVRHKVLDLLGDLYFLKGWLAGRIYACNTSHRLNLKFLKMLESTLKS